MSFIINSIMLGIGLAMDAFSVSLANGLASPRMPRKEILRIAGAFAFFQFLMPVTGWVCVHTVVQIFTSFEKFIPWIALALLAWIGGGMIHEGLCPEGAEDAPGEKETAGGASAAVMPAAAEAASGHSLPRTEAAVVRIVPTKTLLLQAVATSIDALSVGFAIAEYDALHAVTASVLIAVTTLVICIAGVLIGRRAGTRLSGVASILGGVILIGIGIEIVITHFI